MDNVFDKMFYDRGTHIGGIDESGVIDMAGPLVAACVVLPKIDLHRDDLRIFEVNDCKQVPERLRPHYAEIIWQVAYAIGVGEVTPVEIDYLGTQAAVKLAMHRAVAACQTTTEDRTPVIPQFLLIDGGPSNLLELPIPQKTISKGDTKSLSVAAASIVAKVYRDECMVKLHEKYPFYSWHTNKGHPCDELHLRGLDAHGVQIGVHRLRSAAFQAPRNSTRKDGWKKATAASLLARSTGAMLGNEILAELREPKGDLVDGK